MAWEPQDNSESAGNKPWSRRRATGIAVAGAVTGLVTLGSATLKFKHQLFDGATIRFSAIAWIVAGALLLGRDFVHLRAGYVQHRPHDMPRWTDRHRRRLNVLMVGEALLGATLIGLGCWIFFAGVPVWCGFASAAMAGPIVWLILSEKLRLARRGRLRRGTEWIRRSRLVCDLRERSRQTQGIPLRLYVVCFVWRTKTKRFSVLAMTVLTLLSFAGIANGIVIAPQAWNYLARPNEPHNGGYAAKLGKPTPTATTKSKKPSHEHGTEKPVKPHYAAPSVATPTLSPPTYEENCPGGIRPGDGIAGKQRDEMADAWLAKGEPTLGCAQPAKLVADTLDVYSVIGLCRGRFRSVGVVSPVHPAAVLIDDPADLAVRLLRKGRLRGASQRTPIGNGDFQIVYSTDGSYLLIRPQTTDGNGGLGSDPRHCSEVLSGGRAYVLMPPALADLWLKMSASLGQGSWPEPDASRSASNHQAFTFVSDTGETLARGWCTERGPVECEIHGSGFELTQTAVAADRVDPERVLRFGPKG